MKLNNFDKTILVIGCGNMGSAIIKGWLNAGLSTRQLTIVEPNGHPTLPTMASLSEVNKKYDYIFLGIKPQIAEDIISQINIDCSESIIISILAGKTISFFSNLINAKQIVRVMPNLPAIIGQGCCGYYSDQDIDNNTANLISIIGTPAIKVEKEDAIDSITALSGSGPAYMFLILEAMIDKAVNIGISANDAKKLAIQTMIGAAELANNSELDISTLRQNVTSKGGTTAAALDVLNNESANLPSLLSKAMQAAYERSKELS